MKRLVRKKGTQTFLALDGRWTEDLQLAWEFPDMRSVVAAMQQYHLEGIELVLLMEDEPGAYDVVIPLGKIRPLKWGSDDGPQSGGTQQGGSETSR